MLPQWLRQIPMDCGVVTLENTLLAVLAKRKQGGDSRSTWSRKWPWIRARWPTEVRRPLDDGPKGDMIRVGLLKYVVHLTTGRKDLDSDCAK